MNCNVKPSYDLHMCYFHDKLVALLGGMKHI